MHTVAGSLDVDHDGMVHHAVDDGGGDDGVPQIVAQLLKVNVGSKKRGSPAVAAIDDLEEERSVAGIVLFEAIESDFIDQQDIGRGVLLELLGQALVGEAGEEMEEHVGGGGVAAAVELGAADQK